MDLRVFVAAIELFYLCVAHPVPQFSQFIVPTVLVHGGAGEISDASVLAKREGVKTAANVGYETLARTGSVLEAVQEAVRSMELNPTFNAGYGSVLTLDGKVEMDAAIMNGADLNAGCVSVARDIYHPVLLARAIMERTPHKYLAGDGAMAFAEEEGFEILPEGALVTKAALQELENYKNSIHIIEEPVPKKPLPEEAIRKISVKSNKPIVSNSTIDTVKTREVSKANEASINFSGLMEPSAKESTNTLSSQKTVPSARESTNYVSSQKAAPSAKESTKTSSSQKAVPSVKESINTPSEKAVPSVKESAKTIASTKTLKDTEDSTRKSNQTAPSTKETFKTSSSQKTLKDTEHLAPPSSQTVPSTKETTETSSSRKEIDTKSHEVSNHSSWRSMCCIRRLDEVRTGTVGAVAIDKFGNIAAATSTGGIMGKMPGRIGDSPILGGGTYADNVLSTKESTITPSSQKAVPSVKESTNTVLSEKAVPSAKESAKTIASTKTLKYTEDSTRNSNQTAPSTKETNKTSSSQKTLKDTEHPARPSNQTVLSANESTNPPSSQKTLKDTEHSAPPSSQTHLSAKESTNPPSSQKTLNDTEHPARTSSQTVPSTKETTETSSSRKEIDTKSHEVSNHSLCRSLCCIRRLDEDRPGTVGAVAIDKFGNIAAATSTGGITGKMPGRIGDSPILGGGTYADNASGGVSATGHGETFMRYNVASRILALIQYQGLSAQEATTAVLESMTARFCQTGGVISIAPDGIVGIHFTSRRMAWAYQRGFELHHGIERGEDFVECKGTGLEVDFF